MFILSPTIHWYGKNERALTYTCKWTILCKVVIVIDINKSIMVFQKTDNNFLQNI